MPLNLTSLNNVPAVADVVVKVLNLQHPLLLARQEYSLFGVQLFARNTLDQLGNVNGDLELLVWQWLSAIRLRYFTEKGYEDIGRQGFHCTTFLQESGVHTQLVRNFVQVWFQL